MGSAVHRRKAEIGEDARHLKGFMHVGGTVIKAGKQVTVKIYEISIQCWSRKKSYPVEKTLSQVSRHL
jgi:hypothetical protein